MTHGDAGGGASHDGVASLDGLVDLLRARGDAPALLAFDATGVRRVAAADVAALAERIARGLRAAGLEEGGHVALLAANRPQWVAVCLGVLRAGGVAVPLDAQFGDRALAHVLADCAPRVVFTAGATTERLERMDAGASWRTVHLDSEAGDADGWQALAAAGDAGGELSRPRDDPSRPAVLFYTSGTTGPPKGVPLTHANVEFQLETVRGLGVLRGTDRVCLPLPLHHVYPFVIGLLLPLTMGLPVVMPHALTGPQLVRALREGEASVVIGVPRLYRALVDGIEGQAAAGNVLKRGVFAVLLGAATIARRRLGLRLGKLLLRPVHARFGRALRLLACGGAPLSVEVAWRLEALGWRVATGYGLTETAPLLTLDVPPRTRFGSAGRPIPGVSLRIDRDAVPAGGPGGSRGAGEVQARGPNVFSGYRGLPEATAEAFTSDGWFRTGDLGRLDEDGYLHVEGRASTLLVLEGGENVQPDELEDAYAEHPAIAEIGVFLHDGRLVGLAVPDRSWTQRPAPAAPAAPARQAEQDEHAEQGGSVGSGEPAPGPPGGDLEAAVRAAIAERGRALPSYQRLADVVVTRDALPRTRLGKLRRHELPARFEQARAERQRGARRPRGPMTPDEMSDDDRALLDDRGAAAVWAWLVARHRDVRLTPDTSPALDLGVDSMGWLDLTLEVGRLTGVELDDATIAGIETVRDLLRAVSEREGSGDGGHLARLLERPEEALDGRQRRLLEAPGPLQAACARAAFGLNRLALRAAFRVRARDAGHVPPDGPCLLAPNHASYLDAFALASVLPTGRMERTHFAGWTGAAYRNPVTRLGSRLARVIPIERGRGAASSLALGAAVLARGDALVWFPEGTRSASGRLQRFQPGAGLLLAHLDVPVVPVAIVGAHEALPPGRRLPRLRPITVRFGEPVTPDALAREGEGDERHERILSALRARIEALLADG